MLAEDQKVFAMIRIQDALKEKRSGEAVALLRASREVWPENDAFGAMDAEVEDEFMAMREILFAEIERPESMPPIKESGEDAEADLPNEESNSIFDQPEIEDEDDEEDMFVTTRVEQEFDFNGFAQRFAVKSVCSAYAILLANFEKNSDFTNHCIMKMYHR